MIREKQWSGRFDEVSKDLRQGSQRPCKDLRQGSQRPCVQTGFPETLSSPDPTYKVFVPILTEYLNTAKMSVL